MKRLAFPLLLTLMLAPVHAGTNGTYATQDGGYRIGVEFGPSTLTVREPNKVSVYRAIGGNVYHFTNPTNGIEYLLEKIDARTLLAYKPGRRHDSTTLVLVQAATGTVTQAPAQSAEQRRHMATAEKYRKLSQEDRIKAQIWTSCSAAALAQAQKSKADAEAYARETARRLKTIMLYPEKTPCEDAIPPELWRTAE